MSASRRSAALVALAILQIVAPAWTRGTAAPAAASADLVTLRISAPKSRLSFSIHRPGETIEGSAREFSGEVTFDPADPARDSSVALRVRAASLETGNRLRDRKMRGDHLETERFPEIVFRSTSIAVGGSRTAPVNSASAIPCPPLGRGERRALVEGNLSLHGVERSLMVPAAIRYDKGSLSAEGCVSLSYSDYGIPIPRFLWLVMDDDIQVRFHLVAEAAGAEES